MQWSNDKANQWYAERPWLIGCNFIPSTSVNQLEMWQEESFDYETIRRELGYAKGLGFNTVRVFLHNLLWEYDATRFKQRIESYLEMADRAGICTLFVLFDDCWNDNPSWGKQPNPIPGIHNSQWVRSPGSRVVDNPQDWPKLNGYVKDIIGAFGQDKRVLMWDLYNEPGSSGRNCGPEKNAFALLQQAFEWARSANPIQPLTAGIYRGISSDNKFKQFLLEQSDVITFHNYNDVTNLKNQILDLKTKGGRRPVVCTEYMARTVGSRFETHLPVFEQEWVGCYNWGLVKGKTQTYYPWDSPYNAPEPQVWFHDIMRENGTSYSLEEMEIIKTITQGYGLKSLHEGLGSLQSFNYQDHHVRHKDYLGYISPINSSSSTLEKNDATWNIKPGLANTRAVSLESKNYPGFYLRHQNYRLKLNQNDHTDLFVADATFWPKEGLADKNAISLMSFNYPDHYIRHRNYELWLDLQASDDLFKKDATFDIVPPLAL